MMKSVHDVKLTKLPENKVTSKTEYTNTQQGLSEEGYKISFKLDMQRLVKALGLLLLKSN